MDSIPDRDMQTISDPDPHLQHCGVDFLILHRSRILINRYLFLSISKSKIQFKNPQIHNVHKFTELLNCPGSNPNISRVALQIRQQNLDPYDPQLSLLLKRKSSINKLTPSYYATRSGKCAISEIQGEPDIKRGNQPPECWLYSTWLPVNRPCP